VWILLAFSPLSVKKRIITRFSIWFRNVRAYVDNFTQPSRDTHGGKEGKSR
jgi:hypothetical protein